MSLGNPLGLSLNITVGLVVGLCVGLYEEKLGTSIGDLLGLSELILGVSDVTAEGLLLGAMYDVLVGRALGKDEANFVGSLVGRLDGAFDGNLDGKFDGTMLRIYDAV